MVDAAATTTKAHNNTITLRVCFVQPFAINYLEANFVLHSLLYFSDEKYNKGNEEEGRMETTERQMLPLRYTMNQHDTKLLVSCVNSVTQDQLYIKILDKELD